MNCIGRKFTNEEAKTARAYVKRTWKLPVCVTHCERCDGYHLRANAKSLGLGPVRKKIANLFAQGFTTREIAAEMNLTSRGVEWHMDGLRSQLSAMNITHLTMILVSLGLIDPHEFVPPIKEIPEDERSIELQHQASRGSLNGDLHAPLQSH